MPCPVFFADLVTYKAISSTAKTPPKPTQAPQGPMFPWAESPTSTAQTRLDVIRRICQTTGIPRLTTDLISAKATKATTPAAMSVTTILTVKTCSMLIADCRACL